ncbi:MAG: alpha/beta hydrolase fold domain-containing protein, partial [Candidatus Thorarchaeota archaeon]
MQVLAIVFLSISIILVSIFVLLSQTFMGLLISEIGLWIAWLPFIMICVSIPFLIINVNIQPRWEFFLLLTSLILNLFNFVYMLRPFVNVKRINKKFQNQMYHYLGKKYLETIEPELKIKYEKSARFSFKDYFSGMNYKEIDASVTTVDNITYREVNGIELKLNVYYPKEMGCYPIIVYIHGGGWMRGSKDRFLELRVLKKLASLGYVVFNIDYRLAAMPTITTINEIPHDNHTILEMVSDVRSAILYAQKNAAKYHGDSDYIFVFGRSAGAHLALLTAFSCEKEYFDKEGIKCSIKDFDLTGVIAFYPITDIKELYEFYGEDNFVLKQSIIRSTGSLEKNVNLYEIFSPISYINEKTQEKIPPVFLSAGKRDRLVDAYQSEELFE